MKKGNENHGELLEKISDCIDDGNTWVCKTLEERGLHTKPSKETLEKISGITEELSEHKKNSKERHLTLIGVQTKLTTEVAVASESARSTEKWTKWAIVIFLFGSLATGLVKLGIDASFKGEIREELKQNFEINTKQDNEINNIKKRLITLEDE